ncbi:nucleotidyltransferase family protein [Martelella alba]|uniref:Nucleotidyltransferase family protein n=2 Tax=Martelella alba TaxID=2590451 RepID=A0A506UEI7_9HYPH|nr:nucleotidyltransferase family protein [Martelella alba]
MTDELSLLIDAARQSPLLAPILENWALVDLPHCWLVAGALAQTLWNRMFGFEAGHGIADIDIVYFDPDDLSERGEARHAARIREAFAGIPAWIDVKNEARVHLWYASRFGYEIAPYQSVSDAIATFPTTATTVALRPADGGGFEHEAPFGLGDLVSGIVRPNKTQVSRTVYEHKSERWQALWPELKVMDWDA